MHETLIQQRFRSEIMQKPWPPQGRNCRSGLHNEMRCFGPGNFGRQGLGPRKLGGIATYFNRYVLQTKGFEAPGSKGAELDSHTARRKTPTAGLP